MSKERRVDPQVIVGLLTDAGGFPLAVHLFEGNKAETKTLIPVLTDFRNRHPETGKIIVVADAGMLSAANLLALETAGFSFIVGSKVSKAPYDLAEHLQRQATPSTTGRRSRPPDSWAPGRTPAAGGSSGSGRSRGIDTTSRRSTR
jgi:transposase